MRSLAALLLVAALAGCDLPTAPERVNPYDPATPGDRIPTAPDSLRLASATPTSVTLVWRDASSFETGVRVERAVVRSAGGQPVAEFEAVALLPAGATTYTDADLPDTATRLYRVVASAAGASSAPSAPLAVAPALERRVLTTELLRPGRVFALALSSDGATLYGGVGGEIVVEAFRVDTGERVGRIGGASEVVALGDGRVAVRLGATSAPLRIALVRDGVAEPAVPLASGCPATEWTVSADGGTAAATCGTAGPVAVWRLPSGAFVRTVGASGTLVRGLSPDGAQVYTARDGRLSAWSTATGAEAWSRDALGAGPLAVAPDGARLLGSAGRGVTLLEAGTGATRAADAEGVVPFYGPPPAFGPQGRWVAYRFERPGIGTGLRLAEAAGLARRIDLPDPAWASTFAVTETGLVAVAFQYGGSDGTEDVVAVRLDVTQPWRAVPVPGGLGGAASTASAQRLR